MAAIQYKNGINKQEDDKSNALACAKEECWC